MRKIAMVAEINDWYLQLHACGPTMKNVRFASFEFIPGQESLQRRRQRSQ